MTPTGTWRNSILRIYWDKQENPSVECPVGDFFACGWGQYAYLNSLAVCVNPILYKDIYTIVDGIKGKGHYVGTYLAY